MSLTASSLANGYGLIIFIFVSLSSVSLS